MIFNRIKQCVLKIIRPDNTKYPETISSYKGKEVDTVRHSVYGVSSMPPKDSLGILFQIEGMGGVQYGIFDAADRRFKNLTEGEVQIGNYLTLASIKFSANGDVTVTTPGNLILNTTGNVTSTIGGDLIASVDGNTVITTTDIDIAASGNTTITTTNLSITATGTSTINGGLTVTGDITANNFISSGISVDFNSHIHTGDSGGDTGPAR
ncbi:MAG: hypothetical protein ACUZ8E_17445 [Candidatus Anammoxibacter sp.]